MQAGIEGKARDNLEGPGLEGVADEALDRSVEYMIDLSSAAVPCNICLEGVCICTL